MTGIIKFNDASLVAVEYFGNSTIDAFIASRHCSKNTARTYDGQTSKGTSERD